MLQFFSFKDKSIILHKELYSISNTKIYRKRKLVGCFLRMCVVVPSKWMLKADMIVTNISSVKHSSQTPDHSSKVKSAKQNRQLCNFMFDVNKVLQRLCCLCCPEVFIFYPKIWFFSRLNKYSVNCLC